MLEMQRDLFPLRLIRDYCRNYFESVLDQFGVVSLRIVANNPGLVEEFRHRSRGRYLPLSLPGVWSAIALHIQKLFLFVRH